MVRVSLADGCRTSERPACAAHPRLDREQVAFGGGEQLAALAGTLRGQRRLAANDQALAGVVGAGDLGKVALVKQRQLQRAVLGGEGLDRGRPQRGIQSSPAGASSSLMRAWVIIPRSPTSTTRRRPKRCRRLVELGFEGARVGGIAGKHLDWQG
jgi:hypothetical protein